MQIIKFLPLLIILNSCNNQTKKENQMESSQNKEKITSPYNQFSEGEMQINYDTFIKDNIDKITTEINNKGYKIPDKELFNEKTKFFYNIDIENYTNVIALQKSLISEVIIQDKKIIYIEGEQEEFDGNLLYNYNNFIIYDNKISFEWLKNNRSDLLSTLVKTYGFDKNDDVLKFVFNKVDFKSKSDVADLIFDNQNQKRSIRSNMLKKIREIVYNGKIVTSFSDSFEGDLYSTIPDLIERIDNQPTSYDKKDYIIASLMNECTLSGQTDFLVTYFTQKPDYLKSLKSQNFFNFKKLEEYVNNIYDSDESLKFIISDKDGYTNLRKEKNKNSEIISKLNNGTEVFILDKSDNDWWLIETLTEEKGYVHKSRIVSK
ncbi:Bacterial SH3 domain protein [Flavobacterium columnare]|nr:MULTISPECIES: SH3 domain-containing protein [Flavobacterium]QYS89565.1 SH3 domain-containing protein [Flavobacterium davisii]SPE76543.1 Bacterial SH3 domain protein [Flavobacterium columnare]